MDVLAQHLATEWESPSATLPTVTQLYQLGSMLAQNRGNSALVEASDELLQALPEKYVSSLLQDLKRAFLESGDVGAVEAMVGVHSIESAARSSAWTSSELERALTITVDPRLYSSLLEKDPRYQESWEDLLEVLHLLHDHGVDFVSGVSLQWRNSLLQRYPDQTDYLESLLEPSQPLETQSTLRKAPEPTRTKPKQAPRKVSAEDELDRRIAQVRHVLPDLGVGFVEALLSHYKGNVEASVSAILEGSLPTQLQQMDRSLPRRHMVQTKLDDAEARAVTQHVVRTMERQERQQAQALEQLLEYDDEYDDQYDDAGPSVTDGGLYDDYEAVQTYNQVVRGVEREQAFWDANRNTNQRGDRAGQGFRGPDKIKGGRMPKPPPPEKKADEKGGEEATKQKGNQRHKANKMNSRRGKQKQAAAKKTG